VERVLLIDGYNVILRDPFLRAMYRDDADAGRARLLAMVSRRLAIGSQRGIVVFDGGRTEEGRVDRGSRPGVEAVFARDADVWIRRRISSSRRPEWMTVVTSDAEVARFSQSRGAVVRSSEAFLEGLRSVETPGAERGEKPEGETKAGVDYWLTRFRSGEDGE
jgi:predicted RNA-binding protein with PIN domain